MKRSRSLRVCIPEGYQSESTTEFSNTQTFSSDEDCDSTSPLPLTRSMILLTSAYQARKINSQSVKTKFSEAESWDLSEKPSFIQRQVRRRRSLDPQDACVRKRAQRDLVRSCINVYRSHNRHRNSLSLFASPLSIAFNNFNRQREYALNASSGTFDRLPDELVLYIFQTPCLTAKDHARLSQTCKRFCRIVDDPSLWRSVTLLPFRGLVDDQLVTLLCQSRFRSVSESSCTYMGRLRSIDLSGCSNITDTAVKEVARCSPGLMSINLSGCVKITDEAVRALANNCRKLAFVNLCWCCEITDASLEALSQLCLDLCDLNASWTGVSDGGLGSLALHARNLKFLHLGCNTLITDHGVCNVVFHCKKLAKLDVSLCDRVTGEFLQRLVSSWQPSFSNPTEQFNLQELNVISSKIPGSTIDAFSEWRHARHTRTISIT